MSGFQYKKNVYVCRDCGQSMTTIDRDKGVTPFTTSCTHKCKPVKRGFYKHGTMESCFYRVDQNQVPSHEWYSPNKDELAIMKPSARLLEHIQRGGLVLREIPQ